MKLLAIAALAAVVVPPCGAAVRFEDWRSTSLSAVTDRAARERRKVVLVVTQPDWCPPCILLDKKWLKNDADTEVAEITSEALVVEARGYDADDAAVLRKHHVSFRGTPTTFVLAPAAEHQALGDALLVGSIVGAPHDYPARLRTLLEGEDALAALQRTLWNTHGRLARAKVQMELGELCASRGDRMGSYMAFARVRRHRETGLPAAEAAELGALKREAAWKQADTVMLRVRKNYSEALEDIVAYQNGYRRRADERGAIAYSKAWALANVGRVEEALAVLEREMPDDADAAEAYLYFCFRCEHPRALVAGERKASEALWRWPEKRASWLEARGRIERRQNRLSAAERSFAEAVSLETDPEAKLVYEGELGTVRTEMDQAAHRRTVARAVETPHDEGQDDRSGDGRDARRASAGLGR